MEVFSSFNSDQYWSAMMLNSGTTTAASPTQRMCLLKNVRNFVITVSHRTPRRITYTGTALAVSTRRRLFTGS
jgi:hypothetical protein